MRAQAPLILRLVILPIVMALTTVVRGHHADDTSERLGEVGPAAGFVLTAQDGRQFTLEQTRGKVVAISFTYTSCTDTCPMLTSIMVSIQNKLGNEFGSDVFFVTITMDPEVDRPEVLYRYANALRCDLTGWAFLTGTEAEIRKVAHDYGVFRNKRDDGEVDHTLLTSIIDRRGITRVQYIGTRFDPDEFFHDLQLLIAEEAPA
jgi:protein SCO1/2